MPTLNFKTVWGTLWLLALWAYLWVFGFPIEASAVLVPALLPSQATPPHLLPPPPPLLKAKSYLLMDAESGQILISYHIDKPLPPASLTKMMTAYVLSLYLQNKHIHLEDLVPISKEAWKTGGSKMFVKVGSHVSIRNLMQGIIVVSGNDACVAVAEYLTGSQESFVAIMNQQAKRLGMEHTTFIDANGLDNSKHLSTAHDLAILARAVITDFPEHYPWYAQKWFTFNGIKQPNRNRLLWRDLGVDGIKTGHTDKAGFCLAASAKQGNRRLISVIMGSPSERKRIQDSQNLLTYGFRFFETYKLYPANTIIAEKPIRFGTRTKVPVGVLQDTYLTVPVGQYKHVVKTLVWSSPKPIEAPFSKGEAVAKLVFSLGDETLVSIPLVTLQAIPKGGLWSRWLDRLTSLFY